MSAPVRGDWVQGSASREFDLSQSGCVGILIRIRHSNGYPEYLIGEREDSNCWWAFRYARKITKAEGREIMKGWRELRDEQRERAREWRSMGDEIRAFLRDEARQR